MYTVSTICKSAFILNFCLSIKVCCTCTVIGADCCVNIQVDGTQYNGASGCPVNIASLSCFVTDSMITTTASPGSTTTTTGTTTTTTGTTTTTIDTTTTTTDATTTTNTPSSTTTTTANTGSDSGSDSDSDDSGDSNDDSDNSNDDSSDDDDSDDASFFSAFSLFGNEDKNNMDEDGEGSLEISLSASTWMNLYLISGSCVVVNVAAVCLCRYKRANC